ncbi:hypothetical protein AADZ84_05710 [Colwelliaceae bacterium MEBiC 14330]
MNKIILLLTALMISFSSQATLLSIELNQENYQIGDVLQADLVISDIEADSFGFQKLLASFEFNLLWDNALVEYASTSFGNKLDVDPFGPSDQFLDVQSTSLLLSEISYAWSNDLFFAQDGLTSFVLASVNFNVTGTGSGTLVISNAALGDDFGGAFNLSSNDKAFVVDSGLAVGVPEPSIVVLLAMVLLLLSYIKRPV